MSLHFIRKPNQEPIGLILMIPQRDSMVLKKKTSGLPMIQT